MKRDDGMNSRRRQAKELQRAVLRGDAEALRRIAKCVFTLDTTSLMKMQHVIAREEGFADWNAMRASYTTKVSNE